jgi:hypothetical protein
VLASISGFTEKTACFLGSFSSFSGSFGYGKEARTCPRFLEISPTNKHIQILHTIFEGCFSWEVFEDFMFSGFPDKIPEIRKNDRLTRIRLLIEY